MATAIVWTIIKRARRDLRTVLVLVLAGCSTLPMPEQEPRLAARGLVQADLELARGTVKRAMRKLYYKVYRYDVTRRAYVPERGGVFEGFLMHRPLDALTLFPDTTYTDRRFNKIVFYGLEDAKQRPFLLSASATPDGTSLFGLEDADTTPRLRLGIIFKDRSFLAMLGELDMIGELPCLDASARRGSVTDLLRCIGLSGSASGGGASGGGGPPLADVAGLRTEPDCKDNPLGPVAEPSEAQTPAELRRREQDLENRMRQALAERERHAGDAEAEKAYDEHINDLAGELRSTRRERQAMEALKSLTSPSREPPATDQEVRQAEWNVRRNRAIRQGWQREREQSERQVEYWERRNRGSGQGGRISPVQPGGGETPPVSDPRCQGRRVDAARGTLFTNPAFCDGDDPITCLRRQQDSLFSLTEGQCWTETGPDDARTVVCAKHERQQSENPLEVGPIVVPECNEQDFGCWTDPTAPRNSRRQIVTRYLDLTPMGALIAALCSRGGCPDPMP